MHSNVHNAFVQLPADEECEMCFFSVIDQELTEMEEVSDDALSVACDLIDQERNGKFEFLRESIGGVNGGSGQLCVHWLKAVECAGNSECPEREIEMIKCEACEKTTNLWMCLMCGELLCGRREFDGSGGNSHALEHYEETHHAVCVKITSLCAGCEECFCYACDDNVNISEEELRTVIKCFGVDLLLDEEEALESSMEHQMEMSDMLIELKSKEESDEIRNVPLEDMQRLTILPLINVGNTCYANSIINCLLASDMLFKLRSIIPLLHSSEYVELQSNFAFNVHRILNAAEISSSKLAYDAEPHLAGFLLSMNSYLTNAENEGRQQDCTEFLEILLEKLRDGEDLWQLSRFIKIVECNSCGSIRFDTVAPTPYLTLTCSFFDDGSIAQGALIDLSASLRQEYFGIERPAIGYRCQNCEFENCKGNEMAIRIGQSLVSCEDLPPYLFVKVNRVYYNTGSESYGKLSTRIEGAELLYLGNLVDTTEYPKPEAVEDDEPDVSELLELGIDQRTAIEAFKTYNGNLDAIVDDFFNGCLKSGESCSELGMWQLCRDAALKYKTENTSYALSAFIVHLGASYDVGHYVAYVKSDERWIECNDSILRYCDADSIPMDSGILYLYRKL